MSRLIEQKEIPGHYTLSTSRIVIPAEIAVFIREAIDQMWSFADEANLVAGSPRTIYHEQLDPEEGGLVEVCVPVTAPVEPPGGVELKKRPLTKVACTVVTLAEVEHIGKIYSAVSEWIGEHGYRIDGPVQEHYLSPRDQIGPGDAYIQIAWPIDLVNNQ